jgi:regulatory protein
LKSNAYTCAIRLLARREHGADELTKKLAQRGYASAEIEEAILKCQELDLQSDARFVENVCRTRIRQGYGPIRIRQELQQLHIDKDLIEKALQLEEDNWLSYAIEVWTKKYNEQTDLSYAMIQKQKQFLLYRGFSADTINLVFESILS